MEQRRTTCKNSNPHHDISVVRFHLNAFWFWFSNTIELCCVPAYLTLYSIEWETYSKQTNLNLLKRFNEMFNWQPTNDNGIIHLRLFVVDWHAPVKCFSMRVLCTIRLNWNWIENWNMLTVCYDFVVHFLTQFIIHHICQISCLHKMFVFVVIALCWFSWCGSYCRGEIIQRVAEINGYDWQREGREAGLYYSGNRLVKCLLTSHLRLFIYLFIFSACRILRLLRFLLGYVTYNKQTTTKV